MDFPVYHLDFFGNRMLIGVIAVAHVIVNHALAVGAMPLIALMEWRGWRRGDRDWDRLVYRILFVCFVITTSVGALTGVGIWLSASLVNPAAIGSLIRVFFLAWFIEWVVFLIEVSLILLYFLTWHKWIGDRKRRHIAVGALLGLSSWLTMAIIVAILGFMMDSGRWTQSPGLLAGVLNPIYLPQLAFRTPLAMVAAGIFTLGLIPFFTARGEPLRGRAIRFVALWTLAWLPLCAAGAYWYWTAIPDSMIGNLATALATQAFASWHNTVAWVLGGAVAVVGVVTLWGAAFPRRLPRAALIVPFVLLIALLGYFERVREFIRKPFVIQGYMYANGIRVEDYPLLREKGVLSQAAYVSSRTVTEANRAQAGQDMFAICCTRCHTTRGVNGAVAKLEALFGYEPWNAAQVAGYLRTMHMARPYMPPVPGTDDEIDALAQYLCSLQQNPQPLEGAQTRGVTVPPP